MRSVILKKPCAWVLILALLMSLCACAAQPASLQAPEQVSAEASPEDAQPVQPQPSGAPAPSVEPAAASSPAPEQTIEAEPAQTGDYQAISCRTADTELTPDDLWLHLNADGTGYIQAGTDIYPLWWSQEGDQLQCETESGYSLSGTYRSGAIEGSYMGVYIYEFTYVGIRQTDEVVEEVPRPEITWSRSLPDGTVVEEIDVDGNYYFHCPDQCTPEDILDYFRYYYELDESNFACSFYAPETGEWCAFNDLTYMKAASTYKLPLNMYYYDQQARGVYSDSTYVGGTTLDEAHYLSMVWSDNDVSEAMIYYLGSFYTYKKLMNDNYGHLTDQELKDDYWEGNYYNTRFMIRTLAHLYWHMSDYWELVTYMIQACPGEYLKLYSGDTVVAHKEGIFEGHVHAVGITFADDPFLIAVFTQNLPSDDYAYEVIGRINAAFIDYQNSHASP